MGGPGQKFPIEWAAGHGFGSHTYFAVIKAADEPKLAQHTIKLLDDYIQSAPASAGDYLKEHPVYHVSNVEHNHELLTGGNVASDYVWVPSMPATKGTRPSVFRQKHFGANPSVELKKWSQGQDVRVKYKSDKYPWIISAHKFLMKYDYPEDSDTTMMEIPAELGPGKYLVAYQWSGYYDVVDVNVLDVQSTDIFGRASNNPSGYDRNDHCQFISTYTGYSTNGCKALGPNDRVDACEALCTNNCDAIQVSYHRQPYTRMFWGDPRHSSSGTGLPHQLRSRGPDLLQLVFPQGLGVDVSATVRVMPCPHRRARVGVWRQMHFL